VAAQHRELEPAQRERRLRDRSRILVVEDDADARETLARLLEFDGYNVTVASDGDEALSLVADAAPDLVLTDWRMPGLSGLALCLALRQRLRTVPIVVVTSADEVFDRDQPVNARLRKPIDPSLLHRVVINELRGRGGSTLVDQTPTGSLESGAPDDDSSDGD
jgi:two-component system response regulator MprA